MPRITLKVTEHMKTMQDGVAMMGQMKTPDAKGMQMMDREPARTPAGK